MDIKFLILYWKSRDSHVKNGIIINNKEKTIVLQYSKVLKSRNEWKEKAIKRADENREYRKAKKRYLNTIAVLRAKNLLMEQEAEEKKNN